MQTFSPRKVEKYIAMKNIIKSIVFLAILALLLVIFSQIVVPKNNTKNAGYEEKRIKASGIFAEPENTIDVYVVGDSESYSSYVPLDVWNKYGISSYVSGTPAQPLPLTCYYVFEMFKTQKPKVVVLEANTIYRRKSLSEPLKQYTVYVLPIFQYHDRWKSLSSDDFSSNKSYNTIQANKGYNLNTDVKPAKHKEYMVESDKEKKIPKSNKIYVKGIKEACEANGAKLVLYSAPSMKNWNDSKHKGIESFAKELNIPYIDLNTKLEELDLDWSKDTRDNGDHLNYSGAHKVTEYLGKYLHENFELADHRQEEQYKSWNELYEKFSKNVLTK